MKKTLLLATLGCMCHAQAVFDVDAPQSHASFTLADVLHTVRGSFQVKRGTIRFDPSTGAASGEIVVDATSGDSGNGARDKKMHQSILESQKFPEVAFAPARLRGAVNASGESKVEIDGTFTIHGASHPLAASVVVHAAGDRLQAKAHFVVPYVSWGIRNPSTLFLRVSESVDIDLDVSGRITWPRD